jgi:enoyl-[acyl-carrier-protein] reductase (NADH)
MVTGVQTCALPISDLARGITGEITYVDSGFNIMAAMGPES